ncbi:hypothetical protein PIB30_072124 [Stylosanthes scabra]|uniref:GRF-type domain-containing protein n=1 Tax=Stylosanthes scabra TaxID=79078 RepID=A0ABU6VQ17_9FABA|nr:hypothetical protein [Stylosanthes scabra]
MESESAATSSRRRERSSSTQGVNVPRFREEMSGVAPKCRCGVYAILYLSKTVSNPNRLFFGCPFFKGRLPHCKFFMWLDQYIAKMGNGDPGKCGEHVEDVAEHLSKMEYEWRLTELEKRVGCLEQRKKTMSMCYVVGMFLVIVVVYVSTR